MDQKTRKKIGAIFVVIFMLFSLQVVALAAGGPSSDSGVAEVSGSYQFSYEYDSTYHGSLSAERPQLSTEGAGAKVEFDPINNQFTITAVSSKGQNPMGSWWDYSAQNVSTECTIKNTSSATLLINYTYSVSVGKLTNSDLSAGTDTITWRPNQSIDFGVITNVTDWTASSQTATATFKVNSCSVVTSYDVYIYPTPFGSYTYTVKDEEGKLDAESDPYITEATSQNTITLGVPFINESLSSNYVFYGWSVNGEVIASSAAYNAAVTTDMTVFPVIIKKEAVDASGNGPFYVNGENYILWKDAFAAAGTSYPVVLARDYTLPTTLEENGIALPDGKYLSGSSNAPVYIIPSGATLLVPFDDNNTLIKDDMQNHVISEDSKKELYRKLTMPAGTNISVSSGGAISIGSAVHRMMLGQVGPYGAIVMDEGSNITVKSGANLYAWGYVFYGSGKGGTVTIESGGTVYESTMVMDYPGDAGVTIGIYGGKGTGIDSVVSNMEGGNAFPLRSFTIRNIEVPTTYCHGAKNRAYYNLYGDMVGNHHGYIQFIGNPTDGGVFQTGDEKTTVVKAYKNGRQLVEINGDSSLNVVNISMRVGISDFLSYDVDISSTKTSGLALPSCYTAKINSGTLTIKDKVIMCEGARFEIAHGATINTSGNSIYIVDAKNDEGAVEAKDVHEKQYTNVPTDAVLDINGTLIASGGFYTSESMASITSSDGTGVINFTGTNTNTTVPMKTGRNTYPVLTFNAVSAWLQDGDGEHRVQVATPASGSTNTYTYNKEHDRWVLGRHTITSSVVIAPTCTEQGYTTHTCTCGHSYKDTYVDATGHNPNEDDGNCTTAITCSICDEVTTAAFAEHAWDGGTVTTEATATTPGVMTYECTRTGCTQTKTEEIPATGGGEETVYSVKISWSQSSTATYTATTSYVWNPETLTYEAESAGSWNGTTSVMTVTIDNSGSTGGVIASFVYADKADSISGTAAWDKETLSIAAQATDPGTATLTVSNITGNPGDLNDGETITLGTITVTLTKEE